MQDCACCVVRISRFKMYFIDDEDLKKNCHKGNSKTVRESWKSPGKENFSLVDSQLEFEDPTPSIHKLFVLFDRRFFWNKLGMVEVKWSNRMTTCAGLCYYQGRRGLCSIKLSAPLLSLRPRKDLVETLLHEMIHAYLFVTHNNKDREDHGSEFHKHMNRINKEAGTNITVYHTFHDEVEYYQKHIWRCNGICQNRKPFYGFVKRAMNRAPGPYDSWWESHMNSCGGTFIKISEPVKTCKKKVRNEKDKSPKDILGIRDIRDFFSSKSSEVILASGSYGDNFTKTSNIHTLKDLKKGSSPQQGNILGKYSQTHLITRKQHKKTKEVDVSSAKGATKNSVREGSKLDDKNLDVQETVRNIWAKKYPFSNNKAKREANSVAVPMVEVKRREVSCPVCNKSYSESIINEHLDECLSGTESREDLDKTLPADEADHKLGKHPEIHVVEELDCKQARCPICSSALNENELNEHLERCLSRVFEKENEDFDKDEISCDSIPCPCCLKWVVESEINAHIDECLTFISLANSLK